MKRKPLIIVLVAFAFGWMAFGVWSSIMATTLRSNRYALESSLQQGIEAYYHKIKRYPDSLEQIKIDWIKSEARRKKLIEVFYYENRGDTYILW